MTTLQLPSFEAPRPQSHQGVHTSPTFSPKIQRPASQASFHAPPTATYSPNVHGEQPFSAFTQPPYRHMQYQPGMMNYPSTAPPVPFYPGLYDPRSQPMMRTVSHAHPMNSATDHASSRYSSSPHSASGEFQPPSATLPYSSQLAPPAIHFQQPSERHINPSVFNPGYPMSRSVSAASEAMGDSARLLTPHYEYREQLSPNEMELRKVSDTLGGRKSFYPNVTPNLDYNFNVSPHPQPETMFFGRNVSGNSFAMSSERHDFKPDMVDTDYERERAEQMMHNKKLLDDMGLGQTYMRRETANLGHGRPRKASNMRKRQLIEEHPSRTSSRIASMHRNTSFADLDGEMSGSDEEYDGNMDEEDDFRPQKRNKAKRGYGRQVSYKQARGRAPKVELSLYGLLQVYPQIPHLFPLFYYTLNNDLTINSDSVPLIGSIPSTSGPVEKAESLRNFFQRGRRVLAQLDAFTARCDRKYEGPEEKWSELDYHTRIAVRDVRRKIVERCENYKYTRRDILDKALGKNKWQPIEQGMVEWTLGGAGDPANDLQNVTLTLPTPPPHMYNQTQRHLGTPYERTIRPFPSRSRIASAAVPRSVSIQMGNDYPVMAGQSYGYPTSAPPMYGEDQVPMSVQMPGTSLMQDPATTAPFLPGSATWEQSNEVKRAISEESSANGFE